MLRSGVGLLRESGRVLLEAAPRDLDPQEIGRALAEQNHVVEVHDLHVWEVTSGIPRDLGARDGPRRAATRRRTGASSRSSLRDRFGVTHSTLQVETRHEGPLSHRAAQPREAGRECPAT